MLIGEVKEGRAELNRNARNPDVLRTVLARFGCCSIHSVDAIVQQLINKGESVTSSGHRIRLIAFGSSRGRPGLGRYSTLRLGYIVSFIEEYLDQNWKVLHHAQF